MAKLYDRHGQHQRHLERLGASPQEVIDWLATFPLSKNLGGAGQNLLGIRDAQRVRSAWRFYPILLQAAQEKCRTYFDRVEQQAAQFAEKKGLNASIQSQQLVKKLAQSLRGPRRPPP